MIAVSHKCPKCNNPETYRVKRGFLFSSVFTFIPVRRFKCYRCFNKFYIF
ncbi:hypothetical protein G6M26_08670 [Agrobacterium tumefaciens]|nr:hypothetical protein [Agrobacterium tumefaciens]NTE18592.1 hypothetical protein [Agrobacterium tumefaciens]